MAGRRGPRVGSRMVVAVRFEMSVWYAEDVKRIARLEHRGWTADGFAPALAADEVYELLSYRPPS